MHWFPVRIYQPSEAFYLAAGSRELLQRKSTLHPGWGGLFVVVVIVFFCFFFYDIFLFMKLSECEVQGCHGNWCKQPPVTWGTAIWYLSPPWGLPLPPSSHCFMGASQDAALYSKPNIGHTGSPCHTAMSGPSRWMAYILQCLHHYFHLCRHWTWQWSERLEWW